MSQVPSTWYHKEDEMSTSEQSREAERRGRDCLCRRMPSTTSATAILKIYWIL